MWLTWLLLTCVCLTTVHVDAQNAASTAGPTRLARPRRHGRTRTLPDRGLTHMPVDVFGSVIDVPVQRNTQTGNSFTALFITDQKLLDFLLNTVANLERHSKVRASLILCPHCDAAFIDKARAVGLAVSNIESLRDMSDYAFREGGPMPQSAVVYEQGNEHMRRHSPFMFMREWVKHVLLEHGIDVAIVDIDICSLQPSPLYHTTADIVVEGMWPHDNMMGRYSFPFLRHDDAVTPILLNNGHAYFKSSPAMRSFSRRFMGLLASETYTDFGFAQTAFMKLMNETSLSLSTNAPDKAAGTTTDGLAVEAFRVNGFGFHATGPDWDSKRDILRRVKCWKLCPNYAAEWQAASSWDGFVDRCFGKAR